ncbi:MAG TPA: hypothetical protein DCL54_05035 [Alphaproteobacteria bacterium]|nr:hypothetical protein [Alphaproteobacteria bacterium]
MSENVSYFPGVTATAAERNDPNPELIEVLEEKLELARSGMLQGMAWSDISTDGMTRYGWRARALGDGVRLLGGLEVAKSLLINATLEASGEDE